MGQIEKEKYRANEAKEFDKVVVKVLGEDDIKIFEEVKKVKKLRKMKESEESEESEEREESEEIEENRVKKNVIIRICKRISSIFK